MPTPRVCLPIPPPAPSFYLIELFYGVGPRPEMRLVVSTTNRHEGVASVVEDRSDRRNNDHTCRVILWKPSLLRV